MDQLEVEKKIRPKVDEKTIIKLVKNLYGFKVTNIVEFDSYCDKNSWIIVDKEHENPYIETVAENGYVLKILNAVDSRDINIAEGQNELMIYLQRNYIRCPVPVKNLKDSYFSLENISEDIDEKCIVRLFIYCPDKVMTNVTMTKNLLHDVGYFTAKINKVLCEFFHQSFKKRLYIWMLSATPQLRDFVFAVKDKENQNIVYQVIDRFETDILRHMDSFEKGIIHGDINEQNLLINDQNKIVAIIDFGDTHYSCLIFEIIIAVCYMIIYTSDIESGKYVIEGFQTIKKLTDQEKSILKTGVCARISQSLVLGAYSYIQDSKNDYVLITQKNGWKVLRKLWSMSDDEIYKIWQL